MLSASDHDLPQEFLQIKQEGAFFTRPLSKERSNNNKEESSFRALYYGGASGAVPFTWESRPGTPKHPFSDISIPPLTPPPSYQFSPNVFKSIQKPSKPNKFLQSIFPRKKNLVSPFASISSSTHSLSSTPMKQARSRFSRSRTVVQFEIDEDGYVEGGGHAVSPTSIMCFGLRNGSSRGLLSYRRRGFSMKRKLFSLVGGHGKA